MSSPLPQVAREAVLAELDQLAARRKRALAVAAVVMVGAVLAMGWWKPMGARGWAGSLALAGATTIALGIALGVPLISAGAARAASLLSTALVVVGGGLLGGAFVPGAALGLTCLWTGVLAGALGLLAMSMSMGKLWRRSIDVRWPASLGATAVVLAIGASVCGHDDGLHMWVAHMPIVPAVYALFWAGAQVVRRRGRLA